ncbi:MAG: T9SS type A sorting domain-containing protein, partial [Candidatus Cloacimonetes bacterium]|nr:T9SS type A sorting domain-containing protein [Candidatus Cloacimonadota bacterium]
NLGNGDITLPVELSTFTAQFVNGVPTLYWKTESETDNIGWNVYRNTEEEFQSATQINNDLIQGYGTTTEPHSYIYEDEIEDAMPGDMYWYWIQSIDFGGQFHTYQRAVSIEILDPNDPGIVEPPVLYGIKNTPNPFNSYTQIHYTLSESAIVEISIYNILGKLVRTLPRDLAVQDGEAYIGTSYWDGKDENGIEQETGIYLYQLKVNGKTYETKRLTVIR